MRKALIWLAFVPVFALAQAPSQYGFRGQAPVVDVPCNSGAGFSSLDRRSTQTYVMVNGAGWGSLQWVRQPGGVSVSILAPTGMLVTGTVALPTGATSIIADLRNQAGQVVGAVKICAALNFGAGETLLVRAVVNGVIFLPEWQFNSCPAGTLQTSCLQFFAPLSGG